MSSSRWPRAAVRPLALGDFWSGEHGLRDEPERGGVDMTRTTNARIAGFTYLFYAAIGMCIELLMH